MIDFFTSIHEKERNEIGSDSNILYTISNNLNIITKSVLDHYSFVFNNDVEKTSQLITALGNDITKDQIMSVLMHDTTDAEVFNSTQTKLYDYVFNNDNILQTMQDDDISEPKINSIDNSIDKIIQQLEIIKSYIDSDQNIKKKYDEAKHQISEYDCTVLLMRTYIENSDQDQSNLKNTIKEFAMKNQLVLLKCVTFKKPVQHYKNEDVIPFLESDAAGVHVDLGQSLI